MPDGTSEAQKRVREWRDVDRALFEAEIASRYEPAVLRGLVANWPAVAASGSPTSSRDYLVSLDRGAPIRAFLGEPDMGGRFFYRSDFTSFNFQVVESRLERLLQTLIDIAETGKKESIYMGSTPTPQILPDFAKANPLPLLKGKPTEPRIWIGNSSRIAPHFDESDNIACVVSGQRRFTLFPPEQVGNLYVGPLDRTPAGQPASLVDLAQPDFERFPRFREALATAVVADLEPGDAIYIPSLWWHGVQSTGPLNILVNYWWTGSPPEAGSGFHALGHGLLAISHLPPTRREAWRAMFDHFVFQRDGDPAEHIPQQARGILGRSTPEVRNVLRNFLMRALQGL